MDKQVWVNMTKTNWELLRKQKELLFNIIEGKNITNNHRDAIAGIMSLLDDTQDQAAEIIGVKKVFGRLK